MGNKSKSDLEPTQLFEEEEEEEKSTQPINRNLRKAGEYPGEAEGRQFISTWEIYFFNLKIMF